MVVSAGAGYEIFDMLPGKNVDEPGRPSDCRLVAVVAFERYPFEFEQAAYADEQPVAVALLVVVVAAAGEDYDCRHAEGIGQAAETASVAVSAYRHSQNFANQQPTQLDTAG